MANLLGCFGCDTGIATHHQDGAKSWVACECGKFVGQKIDMSDTHHVEFALKVWNEQALAHVEAARLANEKAASEHAQRVHNHGGFPPPLDPLDVNRDALGMDPVDVHANTNTDLPPLAGLSPDEGQVDDEEGMLDDERETDQPV